MDLLLRKLVGKYNYMHLLVFTKNFNPPSPPTKSKAMACATQTRINALPPTPPPVNQCPEN